VRLSPSNQKCSSIIEDFLFLGNCKGAEDLELLQRLKIDCIINITKQIPNFYPNIFEYRNLNIYDTDGAATEMAVALRPLVEYMKSCREKGKRIFVHCRAGVSRSATVVLAYLMSVRSIGLQQALRFVRKKRPCVLPNPGFSTVLESVYSHQAEEKSDHLADFLALCQVVDTKVILPKIAEALIGNEELSIDDITDRIWQIVNKAFDKDSGSRRACFRLIFYLDENSVLPAKRILDRILTEIEEISIDVPFAKKWCFEDYLKPAVDENLMGVKDLDELLRSKSFRNKRLQGYLFNAFAETFLV